MENVMGLRIKMLFSNFFAYLTTVNNLTINEQIRQFDENVRLTRTKLLKLSVIQGLSTGLLCDFSNLLIDSLWN